MAVAHFVITGEYLTTLARNLLLEDNPGKAYRVIADGLIGAHAAEAALKVLQGTHDLAGDSHAGLELVKAEQTRELERFKRDFAYIYAGRYKDRHGWRRPVAEIVRYGPNDAKFAGRVPALDPQGMKRWWNRRARYHCYDNETVETLNLPDKSKGHVIWEPCAELPHWKIPPASLQEALDQALAAGRRLEERPSQLERELEDTKMREKYEQLAEMKREDEEREKREEQSALEWEKKLKQIGEDVRAQAGDDTFILKLEDGRNLTVPRAPFIRWALCRTDFNDNAPEWNNIAPSGLKMSMDNPDHTDWVLGSGLTLDEAYDKSVTEASWDAAFEFQEKARESDRQYSGILAAMEMLRDTVHKAATVVDAGERMGIVGKDIAVFPDSKAERVDQLGSCIGAIVEQGGKLAHFAIVTKGRGITVMRHANACALFKDGMRLNLNPKTGRIVILENED